MYREGFIKQGQNQKIKGSNTYDQEKSSNPDLQKKMKKESLERRMELFPASKKRKVIDSSATEIPSELSSKKSEKKKRKKNDLKKSLKNMGKANCMKKDVFLQLKESREVRQKCLGDELYSHSTTHKPLVSSKTRSNIEKTKRKKKKIKTSLNLHENSTNHKSNETSASSSEHNGHQFSSLNEKKVNSNGKESNFTNNFPWLKKEPALLSQAPFQEHFDVLSSDEEFVHHDITDLIVDDSFSDGSQEENNSKHALDNSMNSVDEPYDIGDQNSPEPADFEDTEMCCRKFRIGNDYCVVLNYSQSISIFGFCDVSVLHGQIDILGHILKPTSPKYTVYSPRGTALLTLKNTTKFNDNEIPLKSCMPHISASNITNILIRKDSSVVIFSKKVDFRLRFVESHVPQKILPKETQCPRLLFEPSGPWNKISIPNEWNRIVSNISNTSKLFICGGKGVGKSTFLRYALNCLLQKFTEVQVVDLDPGQSEFTVPGTLSIVTVKKPLLGVNYTHLRETDRSILCDISVSQDPHKYMKCVENLIAPLDEEDKQQKLCPTLINFMGFTSDMAFYLLSSAVVMLQPNKIIYIQSDNRKKNFKIKLTKETILNSSNFFNISQNNDLKFDIIEVTSMTDENLGWKLESRQVREMCLLAYFGQLMKEDVNSLQSCHLPAYVFDYKAISITNRDNVEVHVDAINANIIALCSLKNHEQSIFQCYGWGIVRAVDHSQHAAIIITPVGNNVLKKITHFVTGCLPLPPSICMNNENVVGKIPYVVEGELIDFAQMSKRTHIPFRTPRK